MASPSPSSWPKEDKRRNLHAVYRVGDLEAHIKFYTENFGMKLVRSLRSKDRSG